MIEPAAWKGRVDVVNYSENEISAQVMDVEQENVFIVVISLDFVTHEERDLVKPGAIFHLIEHSNSSRQRLELRFQRFPTWSRQSIEANFLEADRMLKRW